MIIKSTSNFLGHYKSQKLQNLVFGIFVLFGIIITYHYGYAPGKNKSTESLEAKKGVLSLSASHISKNNLVQLTGQFSFYWNQLLTPQDFKSDSVLSKADYSYLPSVWNNKSIYNKEVKPLGYATYRLVINVPNDGMYGIKIKEFDCAYKMMVNDEVVEVGKVGTTKESTIPSWRREEIFFYSKNKKVELVFQVANFHHRKGGPEDVMLFGTARSIRIHKVQQGAMSVFLFGVLFILGLYFLLMYIVGRRETSVIWFSVLSFSALFRLLSTGEKVLLELVPGLGWELALRIEYLSFILTTAMSFSFLRSFYSKIYIKWTEQFIWTIAILSGIPVLLMSPLIFTYIPIYYQWFILIVGAYMLIGIIVALFKKYEFSGVFFVGMICFYASLVNDVMYFNKVINSGYLMPYGLFILFFSFSFVMSRHLTYAFLDAERYRKALEKQTKHLERQVKKRTNEIKKQKDSIQQQALNLEDANKKLLELNRFKDDMTGMIVHDLKNPLNSIINLVLMKDIPEKDKLIWQAGIEMHNMVLNILDVNKAGEVGFKINKQLINFNSLIKEAVNDVSVNASKRGITIKRREVLNFIVSGDNDILKRVLVNLLINAIRFSPANSVVNISVVKDEEQNIICGIKDQGPGIRHEHQQIIFDRYRSSELSDKSLRSSGLGLTFCKMAIEAHDGVIYVNSVLGEGSEFCIKIPMESSYYFKQQKFELGNENTSQLVNISKECKKKLSPYVKRLSEKEVFEVSDITNILVEIKGLHFAESELIIASINQSVTNCNQEQYSNIVNILME